MSESLQPKPILRIRLRDFESGEVICQEPDRFKIEGFGLGVALASDLLAVEVSPQGAREVGVEVEVRLPFAPEDFLLIPGAVYDGNRFEVIDTPYPPLYPAPRPDDKGPVSTRLPALPHLSLLAGDGSFPCVAIRHRATGTATFIAYPVQTPLGMSGVEILQEGEELRIRLQFPGCRTVGRYTMGRPDTPVRDPGAFSAAESSIQVPFVINCGLAAPDLLSFFATVDREVQTSLWLQPSLDASLVQPLSHARTLIDRVVAEDRWREDPGFFCTNDWDDGIPFQVGWVGGGMTTFSLLEGGDGVAKERAIRNLDFVANHLVSPSGYFYGGWKDGPFNDGFSQAHAKDWLMVRKSGDMLLFLVRQSLALATPRQSWTDAIARCCNAFAQTFAEDGDPGQFVDAQTGRVVVGGSAAAGSAVAGLALAHLVIPDSYLATASEIVKALVTNCLKPGLLTGGPGEILKAPDSESAFGLLEGLVTLWEVTGDPTWLPLAEATAAQFATWVVPYDFPFPPGSSFADLGIPSRGTVIANAQNKHSAPGICTASALPLLKLFRATGNRRWAELAAEISRALPFLISNEERPIRCDDGQRMPPGWANERVNLSDWESPGRGPGEVYKGFCWAATSTQLTAMEMPGVYWQPGADWCLVSDHVEAKVKDGTLTLHNPTPYPAKVTLCLDHDPSQPLGELWWRNARILDLHPGQTVALAPQE